MCSLSKVSLKLCRHIWCRSIVGVRVLISPHIMCYYDYEDGIVSLLIWEKSLVGDDIMLFQHCWQNWGWNKLGETCLWFISSKVFTHIDGSIQKRCNSSADALELHLFCINPSPRSQALFLLVKCPLGGGGGGMMQGCHLNLIAKLPMFLGTVPI